MSWQEFCGFPEAEAPTAQPGVSVTSGLLPSAKSLPWEREPGLGQAQTAPLFPPLAPGFRAVVCGVQMRIL